MAIEAASVPRYITAQAIAIGLIIGILGTLGVSYATIIGDVREHQTRIAQIQRDVEMERGRTDQRIFEVAGLVKEVITSNRELLQVMRIQAELLRKYNTN